MNCIRCSAKALIIRDNKVLTVRCTSPDGPFNILPGGGQEFGETLHEALRRECCEELGTEIEIGDLVHIREYIGANHEFAQSDSHRHQVEFMFACRVPDDYEARMGDAPDDYQLATEWLDVSNLDDGLLYPRHMYGAIRAYAAGEKVDEPVYFGDVN